MTWLCKACRPRRLRRDEFGSSSIVALQPGTDTKSVVPVVNRTRPLWQRARPPRVQGDPQKRELGSCGRTRALRRARRCRPGGRCICVAEEEHGQRR
eukprot:4143463-Pleurochrysis_carterae.AAC.1